MLTRARLGVQGEDVYIDAYYGANPSSGYEIINIEGLEPPKTDVSYSRYALVPGGQYHSSSIDIRNLVFTIGFRPTSNKTVQELRRDLYHAMPPGETLRVRLWNNDSYELRIDGYLEDVEASIFSKHPSAQISIIRPDPYLGAPSTITEEGLQPGRFSLYNPGDIPVGYTVTVNFVRSISHTIYVQNLTTGDGVELHRSWPSGHRLRVRTIRGSKDAILMNSSGNIVDRLIGSIDVLNDWPEIIRGDNELNVSSANSDGSWTWDLTYRPLYGGF